MKINWAWISVGALLGWILNPMQYVFDLSEPEPTCEEMAVELWAFQQCLANQPACNINGPESYAGYHETRNRFEVECGEDRGDAFLSQIK